MDSSSETKIIICLALGLAVLSVADKPGQFDENQDTQQPEKSYTTSEKHCSVDFAALQTRMKTLCVAGRMSKLDILQHLAFNRPGSTVDVEEFVSQIIDTSELQSAICSVQANFQSYLFEGTFDVTDDKRFISLCNQFHFIWGKLIQQRNTNGEITRNAFMRALLRVLQKVCVTIRGGFDLTQHFIIYERLGVLGGLFSQSVSDVCRLNLNCEWILPAIVNMIDDTALFPLLTNLLHTAARGVSAHLSHKTAEVL